MFWRFVLTKQKIMTNNPGGFQREIKVVSASKKGLLQTFALLVTLL